MGVRNSVWILRSWHPEYDPACFGQYKERSIEVRRENGHYMGMIMSITGVGTSCGPPIAGAFIERHGGNYLYAQMVGGAIMVGGAHVLIGPRVLKGSWAFCRNT